MIAEGAPAATAKRRVVLEFMYNAHKVRINRLLPQSGRCLDVAVDHGVFNEHGFLDGLLNMESVISGLVAARPDAIQMNCGQADVLQRLPGRDKPALVLRLDCGNVYNAARHKTLFDILASDGDPVLPAVQWDAACVVVNLLLLPDEPELHRQTIANISRVRPLCEQYRMPLMIEPLVMKENDARGGFQVDGNPRLLIPLVRQARELGADLIKADPTDRPEDYAQVIEAARCPVLVRGGGKEGVETVFAKAHAYLQQGASGLVYGRNIYQHPSPSRIVRGLMGLIHEGWTPEQAAESYAAG